MMMDPHFDMYSEIIIQGNILGEKQIVSDIKIMEQINKYAYKTRSCLKMHVYQKRKTLECRWLCFLFVFDLIER